MSNKRKQEEGFPEYNSYRSLNLENSDDGGIEIAREHDHGKIGKIR